ncbi:olfactory receptor 52B2-like [Macrochelys suwanniensis]
MSDANTTNFINPSTFILLGIPGLEAAHIWISIPFCAMYFVHCFSTMESGILVAMAFDRYVAICRPLRYSTILTNSVVAKLGLAVVLRSAILTLPYPFLTRRWPYCRTNIIPHFYCGHISVVKLACADISVNSYYGLVNLFSVIGMDLFFIAVSYTQILRAIFRLPTKDARLKTFRTCISHLCAIVILYIPDLFSSLIQRFGHNVPRHFLILITSVYQLVPPMLHPIIYGLTGMIGKGKKRGFYRYVSNKKKLSESG